MKYRIILSGSGGDRSFDIEMGDEDTVLDALETLRGSQAPDLSYRHSCHHGSCGTCGAMINGRPALMCLTKLAGLGSVEIRLEPLAKMERISDIAVWPGPLFANLPDTSYIRENPGLDPGPALTARRLEDCIECGICAAACPVDGDFQGPAALGALRREAEKSPRRLNELLGIAARRDGVGACEGAFECSRTCPQRLAPGRSIRELKTLIAERNDQ